MTALAGVVLGRTCFSGSAAPATSDFSADSAAATANGFGATFGAAASASRQARPKKSLRFDPDPSLICSRYRSHLDACVDAYIAGCEAGRRATECLGKRVPVPT